MSSIRKRKAIITVFSILIACTLAVLIQLLLTLLSNQRTNRKERNWPQDIVLRFFRL